MVGIQTIYLCKIYNYYREERAYLGIMEFLLRFHSKLLLRRMITSNFYPLQLASIAQIPDPHIITETNMVRFSLYMMTVFEHVCPNTIIRPTDENIHNKFNSVTVMMV